MPIYWTPKLAVGVPQIDDEHKELFLRINTLLDAMAASRARHQIEPLLRFLDEYIDVHFGGEAALMRVHRYPEAAEHLGQHAYFVAEFQKLSAEAKEGGPSALLTIKLNKLLCDWLRDHIGSTDKKFGVFLAATPHGVAG